MSFIITVKGFRLEFKIALAIIQTNKIYDFTDGKQRLRETKMFAQGHPAS